MTGNIVFNALPRTETMNIVIAEGPMPKLGDSYSFADVGSNDFWSGRTNKSIARLDILRSLYDARNEFGVEFFLDGADSFVMEYSGDSPSFDQLRVTGPYAGPRCDRVRIFS